MENKNIPSISEYAFFAAQNSYSGFISHFGKVFDSRDYDKIYVLKGGPGTGKSSLMKKLSAHLCKKNIYNEAIRCSSDIHSLDGVIAMSKGRKIAVLDGTAPHERDAVIPGAVDEVINLGECWDSRAITERKSEIFKLNATKSYHYKKGYEYLSVGGTFHKLIKKRLTGYFEYDAAVKAAKEICSQFSAEGNEKIRLTAAFGKDGYQRLSTFEKMSDTVVRVSGRFLSDTLFMGILRDEMKSQGLERTVSLSPFDANEPDAIYIEEAKTAYITAKEGDIKTENYISDLTPEEKETLIIYETECEKYKKLAAEEFALASKAHFGLEAIYTPAMNFNKINGIYDKILVEISEILE